MYQFGFHLHLNSTKGAGVEKFILGPGGKIRKSMNYVIRCTNFNMTGLKNKWYFFFIFLLKRLITLREVCSVQLEKSSNLNFGLGISDYFRLYT